MPFVLMDAERVAWYRRVVPDEYRNETFDAIVFRLPGIGPTVYGTQVMLLGLPAFAFALEPEHVADLASALLYFGFGHPIIAPIIDASETFLEVIAGLNEAQPP